MVSAVLLRRKLVKDRVVVGLARLQPGRGKARMIGRIREALRLEAEAVSELIDPSAFASEGAVQKIPRVKLQPRRGRPDFHHAAGGRFGNARGQAELSGRMVEHPV